jgi:hypothetical protein
MLERSKLHGTDQPFTSRLFPKTCSEQMNKPQDRVSWLL